MWKVLAMGLPARLNLGPILDRGRKELRGVRGDVKEPGEGGGFGVCWASCNNYEVASWMRRGGEVEWGDM